MVEEGSSAVTNLAECQEYQNAISLLFQAAVIQQSYSRIGKGSKKSSKCHMESCVFYSICV
jgi:hypothetical protein